MPLFEGPAIRAFLETFWRVRNKSPFAMRSLFDEEDGKVILLFKFLLLSSRVASFDRSLLDPSVIMFFFVKARTETTFDTEDLNFADDEKGGDDVLLGLMLEDDNDFVSPLVGNLSLESDRRIVDKVLDDFDKSSENETEPLELLLEDEEDG